MATVVPPLVLEQISAALARVPLFEGLDRSDLDRVARLVRARTVAMGEVLFRAGEEADRLYIVQSGTLELLPESGGTIEVASVKCAGDTLGELSLMVPSQRAATARASERTNLLVISRSDFARMLASDSAASPIVLSVAKSLTAMSLKGYNQSLRSSLLPSEAPQTAEFEIAGGLARDDASRAEALWDTFPFKGGGIIYAVMEARGSNLAPAHLLAMGRALLREIAASEERFERVLIRLNKAINGNIGSDASASLGVGLMHIAHVITFAIAGAPTAALVKVTGERIDIEQHGPSIGVVADYSFGTTRAELEYADFAAMFTKPDHALLAEIASRVDDCQLKTVEEIASSFAATLGHASQRGPGEDVAFVIARRT